MKRHDKEDGEVRKMVMWNVEIRRGEKLGKRRQRENEDEG